MISTSEMTRLEKESERYGVSGLRLMENAGKEVARILVERHSPRKVLIVCYHGNNGGDGFVAARILQEKRRGVKVAFLGDVEKLKRESLTNFKRLDPEILVNFETCMLDEYDVIVDALLGTGGRGELREPVATAVMRINACESPVVSVDVPTGVDPDTGERSDPSVVADLIITFHEQKNGIIKAGLEGISVIVDIGIPEEAVASLNKSM